MRAFPASAEAKCAPSISTSSSRWRTAFATGFSSPVVPDVNRSAHGASRSSARSAGPGPLASSGDQQGRPASAAGAPSPSSRKAATAPARRRSAPGWRGGASTAPAPAWPAARRPTAKAYASAQWSATRAPRSGASRAASAATSRRSSPRVRVPSRPNATRSSAAPASTRSRESGVTVSGLAALRAHELGEAPHRGEDAGVALWVVLDRHAVALLEHHRELERVDRVEPEPFHEERRIRLDLDRLHVLEGQRLDDELLDLRLEVLSSAHAPTSFRNILRVPQSDAGPQAFAAPRGAPARAGSARRPPRSKRGSRAG